MVSLNLEVLIHRSWIPASDLDLEPITTAFQELASAYSRKLPSKLLVSVPKNLRLDTVQETLALARTVFKNPLSTRSVLWYPLQLASNAPDWKFDFAASIAISSMISAAGWDPASMTVSQMDSKDIRVQCRSCSGGGPIIPWRCVVSKTEFLKVAANGSRFSLGTLVNFPFIIMSKRSGGLSGMRRGSVSLRRWRGLESGRSGYVCFAA